MPKSKHPLYQVWIEMRQRCRNPQHPKWRRYGGRGIQCCDRWTDPDDGLRHFVADMGPKPKDGKKYSIDRVNNDGDYCPENCRWATYAQQARNKTVCSDRGCYPGYRGGKGYAGSGFKGVYKEKRGRWSARIRINGNLQRLGQYATPEHAARVYDEHMTRMFGSDCFLNFPDEATP